MAWRFDNPLYSLATDDQNQEAIKVWEGESLGGIKENNNRLPPPVVGLLVLTIITAFLITAPLWGQRPTAAIYEEYVKLMDTPEVQAIADDAAKMEYIVNKVRASGSKWAALQDRHPLHMDDLRMEHVWKNIRSLVTSLCSLTLKAKSVPMVLLYAFSLGGIKATLSIYSLS